MRAHIPQTTEGVNLLLDTLISGRELKNDAALSRELQVNPPLISKLRRGTLPLGATFVLQVHDVFGLPIFDIKALAAAGGAAAK
jgi:hypothetical protein